MRKIKRLKEKIINWIKTLSVLQQVLIIVDIIFLGIIFLLFSIFFFGPHLFGLIIDQFRKSEWENTSIDVSERIFATEHFNGYTSDQRILTCSNGEEIFYQDEKYIKSYSDGKNIVEIEDLSKVESISASLNYLYVVYYGDLCAYSLGKGKDWTYEGANPVSQVFVNDEQVYFDDSESSLYTFKEDDGIEGVKCFDSEILFSEFIAGDTTTQCRQLDEDSNIIVCVDNNFEQISEWYFASPSASYFFNSEINAGKIFNYNGEYIYMYGSDFYKSEAYKQLEWNKWISLEDSAKGEEDVLYGNIAYQDNSVYELIQNMSDGPYLGYYQEGSYNGPQNYIEKDSLIMADFDKNTVGQVYCTADNTIRIIGYNNDIVYLFDTNSYTISRYDLNNKKVTSLWKVSEEDELSFEWCQEVLFVYDQNNNVVNMFEIEDSEE